MSADLEPRPEFATALREWFVDELRHLRTDGTDVREEPALPPLPAPLTPRQRDEGRPDRSRRRWLLILNAAAVVAVVVGLSWLVTTSDQPATDRPATSSPLADPAVVAGEVCEQFRIDAPRLAMGASPGDVVRAATDVRARATDATARIDQAARAELLEARRLLDEMIYAADRLQAVARGEREAIDTAVANLDLIVASWSRELTAVAGEVCVGLPTLREVF
jgi:hypothetical protein